ncbi:MAG TPA: disulfide bond formation protein B [Actinomycetes bacterium]|nr:disulfide bond formation protein B [Actinomycetes bacterium]
MPDVRTVSVFLALLAITAEAAALVAVALAVASRRSAGAARLRDALADTMAPSALWLAFAVATVATLGSLYYSEVAHFVPCKLCWYQRIAMYPLVPVLGLAALRNDLGVRRHALVLAAIGAPISSWHILVERFPNLETSACDPANPCSLIWVNTFGYLTIPTMALSAFALICALLIVAGRAGAEGPAGSREAVPETVDEPVQPPRGAFP